MTPIEKLEAAIAKLEYESQVVLAGFSVPLIATLHRTIDAQLAILRTAHDTAGIERKWDTLIYTSNALDLADAILGADS